VPFSSGHVLEWAGHGECPTSNGRGLLDAQQQDDMVDEGEEGDEDDEWLGR